MTVVCRTHALNYLCVFITELSELFQTYLMAILNYLINSVLCDKLWVISDWHFARLFSCFPFKLHHREDNGTCFNGNIAFLYWCFIYFMWILCLSLYGIA